MMCSPIFVTDVFREIAQLKIIEVKSISSFAARIMVLIIAIGTTAGKGNNLFASWLMIP